MKYFFRVVVIVFLFGLTGIGLMQCSSPPALEPSEDDPAVSSTETIAGRLEFRLPGFQDWEVEITPPDTSLPGFPQVKSQEVRLSYPDFDDPAFAIRFSLYQNLVLPSNPEAILSLIASSMYPENRWVMLENRLNGARTTWLQYPAGKESGGEEMQIYGTLTRSIFLLVTFHQYRETGRQSVLSYSDLVRSIRLPKMGQTDYFAAHDSLVTAFTELDTSDIREYFEGTQTTWPYNPDDYFMMANLLRLYGNKSAAEGFFQRQHAVYQQHRVTAPLVQYYPRYKREEKDLEYLLMEKWERYKKYPQTTVLNELYYPPEFRLEVIR